jgi:DNA-binding MarR family transcriptional regulator
VSLETFYSRAGHLIRRLNQITVAIFIEETSALGVTTVQYAALQMIQEVPGIDQASLSSMIAFDKTTIVKVLDRLVDKGLITRVRSKEDRRSNLLHITARGNEVLRQITPLMDRIQERILAPLSKDEQQKFLEMLTQLVHVNNVYSRAPLNSDVMIDIASRNGKEARVRRSRAGRKEK